MSLSSVLQTARILYVNNIFKQAACLTFFSSKPPRQGMIKEVDPETGNVKTKKTNIIPKITLIANDEISVTTVQEAEKIAKRRDLKLVKIIDFDTKSQRPVYQLMSGAEYHNEELKCREKKKAEKQQPHIKGEKVLFINARIAHHDLHTQLRKALKWIQKNYEVKVIISGPDVHIETSEKVYSAIEKFFAEEASHVKFCQKRPKRGNISFQLVPPLCIEDKDSTTL